MLADNSVKVSMNGDGRSKMLATTVPRIQPVLQPARPRRPVQQEVRQGARSNSDWVTDLQNAGPKQQQALDDLRDYLLRAVYVYLSRQRSDLSHLDRTEVEQLAEDCVQEALVLILNKLDTFRRESKFTTWAYRIIINVAAGNLRRRWWKDVSIESLNSDNDDESFSLLDTLQDTSLQDPEQVAQQQEILKVLEKTIEEDLTERQRIVLKTLILDDGSTDDLAEELGTNRNNIYKILHDGRKRLKQRLLELDLSPEYMLSIFDASDHAPSPMGTESAGATES